jgi:hypothetical protein
MAIPKRNFNVYKVLDYQVCYQFKSVWLKLTEEAYFFSELLVIMDDGV